MIPINSPNIFLVILAKKHLISIKKKPKAAISRLNNVLTVVNMNDHLTLIELAREFKSGDHVSNFKETI